MLLSLCICLLTWLLTISTTSVVVVILISLVAFGFEASILLRHSLDRRGLKLVTLIIADNLGQAESRYFGRQDADLLMKTEIQARLRLGSDLNPITHQFGLFSGRGG